MGGVRKVTGETPAGRPRGRRPLPVSRLRHWRGRDSPYLATRQPRNFTWRAAREGNRILVRRRPDTGHSSPVIVLQVRFVAVCL
jgi:hypothetical protein